MNTPKNRLIRNQLQLLYETNCREQARPIRQLRNRCILTFYFALTHVQIYWQMVVRGILLIIAVALDSLRRGGGYL